MSSVEQHVAAGDYGSLNGSMQEFLTEMQVDLAHGMLSPRVFNDSELHRAELDRIFTRCWVFVGHVSEIPSPGDYVLRYVGEDQFILVRDEHGEIQLLFNNCVHRGSPVCRAERGNTSHFRCPYHGWIYKNSGEWNGAPKRARAYRNLETARWGLRKAPHVDTYQGLIFVNLDPDAIALREYLGDMCWYLDIIFDLHEDGMSVVGEPHRWIIPSNWKSGAENFVGDAYHVPALHNSIEDVGLVPPGGLGEGIGENVFQIALDGGHGLLANRPALPPPWGIHGLPPEVTELFDLDRLSADQRQFLESEHSITGFTIFPNLSFINVVASLLPLETGLPDALPVSFTLLRQWQPRGPEKFELWNWPLAWNAAPAEFTDKSYNVSVRNFSPSGIFEQDDTVAWAGGPRLGRSPFARQGMKLNLQMGLEGMSDFEIVGDCPWPGQVSTTPYGEMNQRRWWLRWSKQLTSS
jgi:nitrite reductase/ring-hydroxylating ferredoxin subunit